MDDTSEIRKSSPWDTLNWETRVTICEQARASENNLLQSYRAIFMATEMALIIGAFNVNGWLGGVLAISSLLLLPLWVLTCHRRAKLVDQWELMLRQLWVEGDIGEIKSHYIGAVIRSGRFITKATLIYSARWVLNYFLPVIVGLLSGYLVYIRFFDC
jgi:hypothetical protein